MTPLDTAGIHWGMKDATANQAPETEQIPRTNLRWQSREEYEAALRAAGNIPLATYVRDVFLRSLRSNSDAA